MIEYRGIKTLTFRSNGERKFTKSETLSTRFGLDGRWMTDPLMESRPERWAVFVTAPYQWPPQLHPIWIAQLRMMTLWAIIKSHSPKLSLSIHLGYRVKPSTLFNDHRNPNKRLEGTISLPWIQEIHIAYLYRLENSITNVIPSRRWAASVWVSSDRLQMINVRQCLKDTADNCISAR